MITWQDLPFLHQLKQQQLLLFKGVGPRYPMRHVCNIDAISPHAIAATVCYQQGKRSRLRRSYNQAVLIWLD